MQSGPSSAGVPAGRTGGVLAAVVVMLACRSTMPPLQHQLEQIDERLRTKYGIAPDQTDVGLLDLEHDRVAMIHPDHEEYAASVAKVGILYAWFALGHDVDAQTQHELGLMIKASSNEMAAKYSRLMGLTTIQQTLNAAGFYDAKHGGGIWVGKHYGAGGERIGDPIANHSHAVTVRQLLRFYQLLSRGELVSPAASQKMREIFLSPDIPHDDHKFVKGLHGRDVTILRKWGTWEDWLHDSAIIEGAGRRYVLVGLTHHPKGDAYLEELAREVDDLMLRRESSVHLTGSGGTDGWNDESRPGRKAERLRADARARRESKPADRQVADKGRREKEVATRQPDFGARTKRSKSPSSAASRS